MKLIILVTVVAMAAGQYLQPEFLQRTRVPQNFVQEVPQQFAYPNFRPMFQRLLPYPQAYYQVPQNHYYPVHVQVPRQVLNEQDETEQVDEEDQTEQVLAQVPQQVLNEQVDEEDQTKQVLAQVPQQVLNELDEPELVDEEDQTEQVLAQLHDWQVLNEQVEDITELEICLSKYNYIYKYF